MTMNAEAIAREVRAAAKDAAAEKSERVIALVDIVSRLLNEEMELREAEDAAQLILKALDLFEGDLEEAAHEMWAAAAMSFIGEPWNPHPDLAFRALVRLERARTGATAKAARAAVEQRLRQI